MEYTTINTVANSCAASSGLECILGSTGEVISSASTGVGPALPMMGGGWIFGYFFGDFSARYDFSRGYATLPVNGHNYRRNLPKTWLSRLLGLSGIVASIAVAYSLPVLLFGKLLAGAASSLVYYKSYMHNYDKRMQRLSGVQNAPNATPHPLA